MDPQSISKMRIKRAEVRSEICFESKSQVHQSLIPG